MQRRGVALACAAFVLALQAIAVPAADHDAARRAYESGEVVGLPTILARVRSSYEGRVLEIELDRNRSPDAPAPWVYAVTVLTPAGHMLRLHIDARTAAILTVTGRGAEAARKNP